MNRPLADKIANATLYEGYILYPYRPSVKSQQRWTFGGVYPKSWCDSQKGSDLAMTQTEVLVASGNSAKIQVVIRFLHLVDRTVGEFPRALDRLPVGRMPEFHLVSSLQLNGKSYRPWQEAVERKIDAGEFDANDLIEKPAQARFAFHADRSIEPLKSNEGTFAGLFMRQREDIEGVIEISAVQIAGDLLRIHVAVRNCSGFQPIGDRARDQALLRSLVSMHVILGIAGGEFISLTDAPPRWQAPASECQNIGLWPVLVGTGTERDTMLASPIILYDYPQLAPESPGDLFDSTEIDEILTLRILTLTEEEKQNAASLDPRVRDMLARTESLARDQLKNLHGTIRGLRPMVQQEQSHG